mmetsp:Transcript_36887/g.102390  ORF Transcript_36887/g.102390 Transcript_36887/m.102390 type:complete len:272 (+) Transcript_36887:1303-2118(+)
MPIEGVLRPLPHFAGGPNVVFRRAHPAIHGTVGIAGALAVPATECCLDEISVRFRLRVAIVDLTAEGRKQLLPGAGHPSRYPCAVVGPIALADVVAKAVARAFRRRAFLQAHAYACEGQLLQVLVSDVRSVGALETRSNFLGRVGDVVRQVVVVVEQQHPLVAGERALHARSPEVRRQGADLLKSGSLRVLRFRRLLRMVDLLSNPIEHSLLNALHYVLNSRIVFLLYLLIERLSCLLDYLVPQLLVHHKFLLETPCQSFSLVPDRVPRSG